MIQRIKHYISMPFIWILIVPMIFMDILMEIYHRICFPLYGMPHVKRSRYIRIDRHKLEYLPWTQKIGCVYCGYANGLMHYATVIAANSEHYWCNIMHQRFKNDDFIPPSHHKDFLEYGNKEQYKNNSNKKDTE